MEQSYNQYFPFAAGVVSTLFPLFLPKIAPSLWRFCPALKCLTTRYAKSIMPDTSPKIFQLRQRRTSPCTTALSLSMLRIQVSPRRDCYLKLGPPGRTVASAYLGSKLRSTSLGPLDGPSSESKSEITFFA